MNRKMTVADFFCGAGGFSEGFRQVGFDVSFALDNWTHATETHVVNHPSCNTVKMNILELEHVEEIEKIVPDTDVIIGSPPCVSFSLANKAGKANKNLGIKLIEAFLRIVAIKKHKKGSKLKYWVMENVPNSRSFVKHKYTFKDLGFKKKDLDVIKSKKKIGDVALDLTGPENRIYNALHYGVPQNRDRAFFGEFPHPEPHTADESQWISLGGVLSALKKNGENIVDPIYGIEIPDSELTDHYYRTTIPEFLWEEAMIKKQQGRYYGRMSFPEDESKPSRTVIATRNFRTREAIILPNGTKGNYRSPTVREMASLMSFPITYLFQGVNEPSKYCLVGNAVCPLLARAIATKILEVEKRRASKLTLPRRDTTKLVRNLRTHPPLLKVAKDKNPLTNFVEIVPDLKLKSFRVEIDNNLPRTNGSKLTWSATIHHATGKDSMKFAKPPLRTVEAMLKRHEDDQRVTRFIKDVRSRLTGKIPPAKVFQEQHCLVKPNRRYLTPRKSLKLISDLVEKHFPETKYGETSLSNVKDFASRGCFLKFNRGEIPDNRVPLRIVAALFACVFLASLTK